MSIQKLSIQGVRNLKSITLSDCQKINVITGPNGSGKTSILEAIYMAGLSRSFRSTKLKPVINYDLPGATVFAALDACTIGVTRSKRGKHQFRINKEPADSAAQLAKTLPIQLIHSDSFSLIDGSPKVRRQFIDWGVFHVKHDFLSVWRRAQQSIKQRNSLLRRDKQPSISEMHVWNDELLRCANYIDQCRQEYTTRFTPVFYRFLNELIELPGLKLEYYRGWDKGLSLNSILTETFYKEIQQGRTLNGPHRANLLITNEEQNAADVLSRGQQKLVVCALKLAQGYLFEQTTGLQCTFLLDDLPAELDIHHRKTLCRLLEGMKGQIYITCVDADSLNDMWNPETQVAMFHVKHGELDTESK